MSATVILAAVGAGKTEVALQRLNDALSTDGAHLKKAWVLLATRRQEVDFRQRLADLIPARSVYFNVEFFNFYDLYARLLNLAGQPQRRIHETARPGLIRYLLNELRDEGSLTVFEAVTRTPGFVRIIADLIYELKQNQVYPEDFENAASTPGDREIALIYSRYQAILKRYRLVDREGESWLALEAVRDHPDLVTDVDLLVVDGFDQFTPLQAKLLAHLGQQTGEMLLTLTTVPGREKNIGRRFERALERLREAHAAIGAPLAVDPFRVVEIERHPVLRRLTEKIFLKAPPLNLNESSPVRLIEAPDAAGEAAAMLRRVKQLLLAGTRPDDILIALRDLPRYQTHFETYGRLYDLPLLMHYSAPIAENPAVAVLMKLLETATAAAAAPSKAFRRRDMLEILRSPYLRVPGLTPEMVDKLDHISIVRQVIAGKQAWLDAIESAAQRYDDEEGQEIEPLLNEHEAAELSLALESFCNSITPKRRDTPAGYVDWLDKLIGKDNFYDDMDDAEMHEPNTPSSLNMPECIRAAADTDAYIASRDTAALNTFKDILRGFLQTQELLRAISRSLVQTEIDWETFYTDVKAAVGSHLAPQRTPIRSGRILVTTTADARGLPHSHVFIPGLSEGIFPAPAPEDPLYLDSERERLRQAGVLLEPQAERVADDGLFYELISLPLKTLTLSRPTVRDGKPWMPSYLWRMVKAVFIKDTLPLDTIRIGQVVSIEKAAALNEAVLALAAGLDGGPTADCLPCYAWLMNTHPELWEHVLHGQMIESRRMSREQHDNYSGRLLQPELLATIQAATGDGRVWSATQLNDYAACGFRFLAKRLLKLEALEEPEEGLDALQLGLIYHKILEETYQEIDERGMAIEPPAWERAIQILRQKAKQVFQRPPEAFRVKTSAQWAQEQVVLLRRLEALVRQDFSEDAPLAEFGDSRRLWATERKFRLWIPVGGDIGRILVAGSIDRVDVVNGRLVALDYKTGTTPIDDKALAKMQTGRQFQMMVYLLALHELARQADEPLQVAGGLFWHIGNLSTSGKVRLTDTVHEHEAIRAAQAYAAAYIQQARQGHFPVQPTKSEDNGRCSQYCEFHQLCRVSITRNRTGF